MPKMTLLDMVQEILSDMNSDNVNSISDTIEAQQVASIIKRTYFNMHSERIWPHMGQLFRLQASTDNARPTHMKMQEDVTDILWAKYDIRKVGEGQKYVDVAYMHPEDFLDLVMNRNPQDSNVQTVIDFHGTPVFIRTDHHPSYFTTFDDEWLVFDSFDSTVDSTLQHSKTQVFGHVEPKWVMDDYFIPDIPNKAFSLLLADSKTTAFLKIKEVFSQADATTAARHKAWLSREKRRVNPGTRYPDYGKPSKGTASRRSRRIDNKFTG